jgi:hypothetical protein
LGNRIGQRPELLLALTQIAFGPPTLVDFPFSPLDGRRQLGRAFVHPLFEFFV